MTIKKPDPYHAKTPVADPTVYGQYCTCGQSHPQVDVIYYAGKDAAAMVAWDLKQHLGDGSVLVLADENTQQATGRDIVAHMDKQRVRHQTLILPGDVTATDKVADAVQRKSLNCDLILAVGAGTINDLGKFAAAQLKRSYWSFPTAPSMNGFTSAIAAIKVDGVKRTLPAPPPRLIYIDLDTIGRAPLKLMQAGYGDMMAKSVSDIDWQIESLLFSGSYCRLPSTIVAEAEAAYLDRPEALGKSDPETAMALLKGLLVSGAAMSMAGSSAPASGGEHLFSHFLDMREVVTGRIPELHGLQVAAGIVVSAACYRRLSKLSPAQAKLKGAAAYRDDLRKIPMIWKAISAVVEKRFALKRDALQALEHRLPKMWEPLQSLCRAVRSPQHYAQQMRRTGYALTIDALDLSEDEFMLAATNARAIRERITVLDIAAHAGVLEAAAADAFQLLR